MNTPRTKENGLSRFYAALSGLVGYVLHVCILDGRGNANFPVCLEWKSPNFRSLCDFGIRLFWPVLYSDGDLENKSQVLKQQERLH